MAEKLVRRLRWWHRKHRWVGHAGWVYGWSRPFWIGENERVGGDEPYVALRRDLDTANYGPFRKLEAE